MLGVGGFSFSRGMGELEKLGLTERAGSTYDSLNFPFTLVPLGQKVEREKVERVISYSDIWRAMIIFVRRLTCKL